MIYVKSRSVFGSLVKIVVAIYGFFSKGLSSVKLGYAVTLGIMGIILYYLGVFENHNFKIFYFVILGISVLYSIICNLSKASEKFKGKKKTSLNKAEAEKPTVQTANADAVSNGETQKPIQGGYVEKPKYYRVKQNHGYIMAEYSDRVELYKIVGKDLQKVRTDYKS